MDIEQCRTGQNRAIERPFQLVCMPAAALQWPSWTPYWPTNAGLNNMRRKRYCEGTKPLLRQATSAFIDDHLNWLADLPGICNETHYNCSRSVPIMCCVPTMCSHNVFTQCVPTVCSHNVSPQCVPSECSHNVFPQSPTMFPQRHLV